jgi:hypothetical protein
MRSLGEVKSEFKKYPEMKTGERRKFSHELKKKQWNYYLNMATSVSLRS